ncbi:MAG: SCO family protein [Thermoanaerobaculia bacterium]
MRLHVALALLALVVACRHESDLPKLYPVPSAPLIAETGKPTNLDDLHGRVVVYSFIFTRCGATCPIMTRAMRGITEKIDDGAPVAFVSVSVDPVYDTPQVLSEFAKRERNDPRWTFLTGDRELINRVSTEGFKLAATSAGTDEEPILHSSKFIVADKKGMIRAYYNGMDQQEIAKLVDDVRDLAREDA